MAEPVYKHPRKFRRTALSILVQYRFNPYDLFSYEYTSDLSPGGVFLRTDEKHEVGEPIYLQFSLRDGSKLIETQGRVARVIPKGKDGLAGIGVEFVNLDEKTQELIRSMCEGKGRARPAR